MYISIVWHVFLMVRITDTNHHDKKLLQDRLAQPGAQ